MKTVKLIRKKNFNLHCSFFKGFVFGVIYEPASTYNRYVVVIGCCAFELEVNKPVVKEVKEELS